MLDMLSQLLPENRYCADRYLTTVWPIAVTLTMSLDRDYSYLQGRFQEYVDIEEERIQKNLEAVHYRIDAVDTLYLMVGSGRIEKVGTHYKKSYDNSHTSFSLFLYCSICWSSTIWRSS